MCAGAAIAQDFQSATPRMREIESRYSLKMICIERTQAGDVWLFVAKAPKSRFQVIPIAMPKNATNKEAEAAIMASVYTELYYESQLPPAQSI